MAKGDGYALVYVISVGRHCKIGWTRSIDERLRTLRTYCPLEPKLRFYQIVPRARALELEQHVHKALDERRTNGEWFRISPSGARDAIYDSREDLGIPQYYMGEDRIIRIWTDPQPDLFRKVA